MTLYRNIGFVELTLIFGFISFYLLYIIRVYKITLKFKKSSLVAILSKLIIRISYCSLMLFALLDPSFGEMKKEIQAVGKDIYFAVDLSLSMNAQDIQPSRLEKTKFELKKLVKAFNSDRLGLIIFSSDAFLQCPLTFDNSAISLFINSLNTGLISNAGTDFTPPLRMALKKHEDLNNQIRTKQKSKIIILVSDGEDFGEETEVIANQIKDKGIKLFTLGVGTHKGSKILQGYKHKRDKKGNDVVSKLNSEALKKLSKLTGGKYFELSKNRNDISRLINSINNIEGEFRSSKKIDVAANKYYYFLFVALAFMLIDIIISLKIIRI